MAEAIDWRSGVKIVRGGSLTLVAPGRATAFDFSGIGGEKTWIGSVVLSPKASTGAHHHGRHEVGVYVAKGRSEIRWGERLEFAAEVGPGDFIYFAPHVPHQETNVDEGETVGVVVRSDNERIAVGLDIVPVARPETIV